MKKHILPAIAFLGLASVALPSAASNFYMFADAGRSTFEVDGDDSVKMNGFSLGAGYHINDIFAVELAYRDLGEESESDVYIDEFDVDMNLTAGVTAVQASVVASYPLTDALKMYGRAGMARFELEATAGVRDGDVNISATETVSENKAIFGVGLNYALSEKFGLRAEYSRAAKWDELQISTFGVGASYRF